MWSWLRDRRFAGYKFRREHSFGPYFLDFFCVEAWVNIELDGIQHSDTERQRKDNERDEYLAARGIKVLRYQNPRLRQHKNTICDQIWQALQERAPQPENRPEETRAQRFTRRAPAPQVADP